MIASMFPSTQLGQMDNYYLLNLNKDIVNELFIVSSFFLVTITITIIILHMLNDSTSNDRSLTDTEANEGNNPETPRLHNKLLAQFIHNTANPGQPLNYMSFPSSHLGHLNIEERVRLVSILRSSIIADQFRYGSSIGTLYIKNTYRYPTTSPEMIGVVMHAASVSL